MPAPYILGDGTEFATRLRRLRLNAGLSQWQLSKKANVSPATISRLEHGHHTASKATRKRLARALKTASL